MASRRAVAGSLRCPCGSGGPRGRPVVACLRSAGPRWPGAKSGFTASRRRARRRIAPVSRFARMSPRRRPPPPPVRFGVTCALPRGFHAPEPRTGAPVPASVRRASEVARTGRSVSARLQARGEADNRAIARIGGTFPFSSVDAGRLRPTRSVATPVARFCRRLIVAYGWAMTRSTVHRNTGLR